MRKRRVCMAGDKVIEQGMCRLFGECLCLRIVVKETGDEFHAKSIFIFFCIRKINNFPNCHDSFTCIGQII